MIEDYINAKAPPLRRQFRQGEIGTDAYREAIERLPEDARRKIESLEALLKSGGFRLLCDQAENEAAAQVARLHDIAPTDAASVAEVQRSLHYAARLRGAVADQINLIASENQVAVREAAAAQARTTLDAEDRVWRDF